MPRGTSASSDAQLGPAQVLGHLLHKLLVSQSCMWASLGMVGKTLEPEVRARWPAACWCTFSARGGVGVRSD